MTLLSAAALLFNQLDACFRTSVSSKFSQLGILCMISPFFFFFFNLLSVFMYSLGILVWFSCSIEVVYGKRLRFLYSLSLRITCKQKTSVKRFMVILLHPFHRKVNWCRIVMSVTNEQNSGFWWMENDRAGKAVAF